MRGTSFQAERKAGSVIAAALIVRDEARCIARCLESVRPWVDHMVVVDTGSTDDTPQLARQCGAQVHHFEWQDDFSIARNHALDLADADWTLVIDADEWIGAGGESIRLWCEGEPRIGFVCIHNAFDLPEGGLATGTEPQTARSWMPRLLPRGVRYEGRIHEQPRSSLPAHRIDLHLEHDGYRDAVSARKQGRNGPLLLRELQEKPGDPYILYQLGKDAEARKDYGEASGWYRKAFARVPDDAGWLHPLIVRHLNCLGQSGALDEAMELASELIEKWQESPDFFFVLGNLALDRALADPAEAIGHWLPLAASAWERCLAIGERPELEGSVEGRGSHLAQHNLAVLRAQLGSLAA